jgi:hypothetical protein
VSPDSRRYPVLCESLIIWDTGYRGVAVRVGSVTYVPQWGTTRIMKESVSEEMKIIRERKREQKKQLEMK